MLIIYTVTLILAILVNFIDAQSCETPTKERGECISLYKCEFLQTIVKKYNNTTPEELKFLRASHCGFENDNPKVCCPISNVCVTPEGDSGKCIELRKCTHIMETMRKATSTDQIAFIRKYVCEGPDKYSVCCGHPSDSLFNRFQPNPLSVTPVKPNSSSIHAKCSKMMNAFPPERSSHCCGIHSSFTNKIFGGNETGVFDYPWLVIIEYDNLGQSHLLCGGSLISGKYVLTAAHCVSGRVLDLGIPKYVRLGDYNIANDGQDCVSVAGGGVECTKPAIISPIEKIIPHPDHNPADKGRRHDIALIRLKITAPYTDFIRPICLPSADYVLNTPLDFQLFIAGWGEYLQLGNGERLASKVKLYAEIPYITKNVCERIFSAVRNAKYTLLGEHICAGGDGKDSCRGDSGGPLMYQDMTTHELFGIISFGSEQCAKIDVPSIYTNVYKYLSWIRSTIEP